MKLTKSKLKQIIKEELEEILQEQSLPQKIGLNYQFTTAELIQKLKELIGQKTTAGKDFRDLETMITNHIRAKGTPEEKQELKDLRDDLLRASGDVEHSGKTGYERRRVRRAYFKDKESY